MSLIALPLLLLANAPLPQPASKPMGAQTQAVASVQIIAGEEIRFENIRKIDQKSRINQKRVRDGMPMVEFY